MQNFEELFKEILADNKRWSYYNSCNSSIENPWDNDERALKFIKTFFSIARKGECFQAIPDDVSLERACHTVSTFFLGIKIAECFNIDLNSKGAKGFNFLYYWFMACLYHDVGYFHENKVNNKKVLDSLQQDGLEAIQEICDIQYMHNRVFRTLTKKQVDTYLKLRASGRDGKERKIDHGIAGGLMLYDRLRKNFEMAWKVKIEETYSRTDFTIDNLHFSNSHFLAYAKAADAIIRHNVFNKTYNEYIEGKNNKKITKKISIKNNLLFILSLADTIEPLKKLFKLQDMYICEINDGKGFYLQLSKEIYDEFYPKIQDLNEWVDIKVAEDKTIEEEKYKVIKFSLTK